MSYNLIREISENSFSLRRDYDETFRHLEELGISKLLIDAPAKVFGALNNFQYRKEVQEFYILGMTCSLISFEAISKGDLRTGEIMALSGLVSIMGGVLHHLAMSRKFSRMKTIEERN
ncbi:MAG: hypothetical protein AABX11_02080 [Nanoarchaeota archaeon]